MKYSYHNRQFIIHQKYFCVFLLSEVLSYFQYESQLQLKMGKLKLLRFGLGHPELFLTQNLVKRGRGEGFENSLRNIASNKGLAYLVSPQIGQFWRALVLLKPGQLKENQWRGYQNMKNSHYRAFLNFQVLDRSEKEMQIWQECPGYPGIRLKMLRSQKIKVKYETQRKFEQKEQQFSGFEAQIMQQAHDTLQALDPLVSAKDIEIIDKQLKNQHGTIIREYLHAFLQQRNKQKQMNPEDLNQDGKANPYKRTKEFNNLRREVVYCISENSHN